MLEPAKTSAVLPSHAVSIDEGQPPTIADGPRVEPADPAAVASHQPVDVPSMVLETLPWGTSGVTVTALPVTTSRSTSDAPWPA